VRLVIYHGWEMKALRRDLMPEAEIIEIPDAALPPAAEPATQQPLMVLPESQRYAVKRRGHAGRPGTGPAGETCGTCASYTRKHTYRRAYRKCALAEASWSSGPGSDIRKRDPACGFWSKQETKS
jgi:hypothetical protein